MFFDENASVCDLIPFIFIAFDTQNDYSISF